MKKIAYIVMLSALMLPSCGKKEAPGSDGGNLELKVCTEPSLTKASVGSVAGNSFPVLLQEGDVVSINGTLSSPLTAESAGGTEAAFRFGDFSGSAPYNLLYPGATDGRTVIDGSLPAMYASVGSLGEAVTLHQLGCGLRVLLHGDLSLSSLTLSAPGGEALAGTFAVDFGTGSLSPVSPRPSICLNFDTPIALSPDTPSTFFIFFVPGTFSEGLVLRAESPEGDSKEWRYATGGTFVRGRMYLPEEADFSFTKEPSDGSIECILEGFTEDKPEFEP